MRFPLLAAIVTLSLPCLLRAQEATFRTTYSGAIFLTPINTAIRFVPHPSFEPLVSVSLEYSFPKSASLGYELSGGFYPFLDRAEMTGQFGIRHFLRPTAPLGAYWEIAMMGGVSQLIASTGQPDPLVGVGLRFGSVRTTRFGDFSFEYGGGPSVVHILGETQLRAEFFFGMGFLLGKEIRIEH